MNNKLQREFARLLLQTKVGERLPSMRELAARYDVSLGTVHAALAELEAENAVTIEARGRKGSYLQERAVNRLWLAAEQGPLVIALPLPSTLICEGLATALKTLLGEAEIPAFMIFLRGSRRRLESLRQRRCHVAVMSVLSANAMVKEGQKRALDLPPHTYVQEHRVYYLPDARELDKPPRVLLDTESGDLQRLTELEFQDTNAEFVPATFLQFASKFQGHEADTVVWDVDEAEIRFAKLPVESRSLSRKVRDQVDNSANSATLVTLSQDTSTATVIREYIDVDRLIQIQQAVFNGRIIAEY